MAVFYHTRVFAGNIAGRINDNAIESALEDWLLMPRFRFPTNTTIHAALNFFSVNDFFASGQEAVLEFDPNWVHVEPIGLAMAASWGGWCRRRQIPIRAENLGRTADYAARMGLFQHLGIDYDPGHQVHEEAGRFVPLANVRTPADITSFIADLSALLHLDDDPESLAALQYCTSEMLRNVLEHSQSQEGAYVCAHNYSGSGTHRVTLAVADCGMGVMRHLGRAYPEVTNDPLLALQLAMQPGVTGANTGPFGSPDNAGAGLYVTRSISQGTGGYFLILSGRAAYRLFRSDQQLENLTPAVDPFAVRSNQWQLNAPWEGTVVSLEIRTERIPQFQEFFSWIRSQIPIRVTPRRQVRFA